MSYIKPGRADVHVDAPLTNLSVAFLQSAEGFVADRAFPIVQVRKKSDVYYTYPRGAFLRNEMKKRAPGTKSEGAVYDVDTDSYLADVWALHRLIPDEIKENADSPINLDRDAVEFLTGKALLAREVEWRDTFFATSVWTSELAGVDSATPTAGSEFGRWDRGDSQPIEDVRSAKRTVQGLTGFRPNKMILGRAVFDALLDHPDIVGRVDRGQTTGTALVMRQNLAALLELDEILVMDGIINSADEGAADALDFIGGKHALLVYAPRNPGLMIPSAGYTFAWTGMGGTGPQGNRIRRFRLDEEQADKVEIQMSWDSKKVSADLGFFFESAVS